MLSVSGFLPRGTKGASFDDIWCYLIKFDGIRGYDDIWQYLMIRLEIIGQAVYPAAHTLTASGQHKRCLLWYVFCVCGTQIAHFHDAFSRPTFGLGQACGDPSGLKPQVCWCSIQTICSMWCLVSLVSKPICSMWCLVSLVSFPRVRRELVLMTFDVTW